MNTTYQKIDPTIFRSDVIAAMKRDDMTIADIVRLTGANQSTLSLFINGKRDGMSLESALKILPWVYGRLMIGTMTKPL